MSGWKRCAATGFVALFLTAVPAAALAGDEFVSAFTEAESESETEPEGPGNTSGIEPAVEAPPVVEEDTEQPWTARYLAPAVLVIGIVALIASGAAYMIRVRGRYRVVE